MIVTAVGDMIFNERISHLKEPERMNLLRFRQESDVAIGNKERLALLSYMRCWTDRDRCATPSGPCLAKQRHGTVMVSLHFHDVSHSRAYGIQDTTPPNEQISFRKAIDAGVDAVLVSGPHVLRGIELRSGKPIFFSLGNFIYQYRTPKVIPTDLPHQRDSEIARTPNVSVWDRRDPREVMESVVARMA